MKAFVDFKASMERRWLGSQVLKNRMLRYWGTETIDGVKVFKKEFTVWPNTNSDKVQRVVKMFGMQKQLKESSFKGITRYYLELNPIKGDLSGITKEILATKINSYMVKDEWYTYNLNIHDPSDPNKFNGYSDQQILDYVDANYATLIDNGYIEANSDTLTLDSIGRYILLDNEGVFELEVLDAQVTPVQAESKRDDSVLVYSQPRYETGLSIEYKVKRVSDLTSSSQFLDALINENNQLEARKIQALAYSTDKSFSSFIKPIITDTIWYKSRLRAETTKASVLPRTGFADLLGKVLDTGYVKKKTKWYKKVLSIVVIAVAAILAAITGGGASPLVAAAAAATGAAIAATLLSMYFAKSGDFGAAEFTGGIAKFAGIVSLIAGVTAVLQNIARAGLQGAAQAAGGTTTTQVVRAASAEAAVASVNTSALSVSTATELSTGQFVVETTTFSLKSLISPMRKLLSMFVERREKNKARKLSELSEEIKQQEQELDDMNDKELHLGIEDIKWYTSPIKGDNLQFEVDHQYEGTKFNVLKPSFYPATGLNIRT